MDKRRKLAQTCDKLIAKTNNVKCSRRETQLLNDFLNFVHQELADDIDDEVLIGPACDKTTLCEYLRLFFGNMKKKCQNDQNKKAGSQKAYDVVSEIGDDDARSGDEFDFDDEEEATVIPPVAKKFLGSFL